MTPDRWAAIERVYQAARDLDGRQRSSFLDHACGGDAALRQEVESLLAYEPAAARFLESSAPEAAPENVRRVPRQPRRARLRVLERLSGVAAA